MKVWEPPDKAKFDQGANYMYRWVLCFRFVRKEHLKTYCFKYSYIDPRKTDTCCYFSFHVDSFNNLDSVVQISRSPPI